MRRYVPILVALGGLLLSDPVVASACGDKFLLLGRGVNFRRAYAAVHPASILIYAQPQRHATKAIRDPRLQNDLKQAGHRVTMVETEAALARALESDRVDLVLTDVADADRVFKAGSTSPSKPTVLPVMYEPTRDEAKAIAAQYQCRLTASDKADRYLTTIDDAMKTRIDQKKRSAS
jgi:AmiR/NasT family two-component response regulator